MRGIGEGVCAAIGSAAITRRSPRASVYATPGSSSIVGARTRFPPGATQARAGTTRFAKVFEGLRRVNSLSSRTLTAPLTRAAAEGSGVSGAVTCAWNTEGAARSGAGGSRTTTTPSGRPASPAELDGTVDGVAPPPPAPRIEGSHARLAATTRTTHVKADWIRGIHALPSTGTSRRLRPLVSPFAGIFIAALRFVARPRGTLGDRSFLLRRGRQFWPELVWAHLERALSSHQAAVCGSVNARWRRFA